MTNQMTFFLDLIRIGEELPKFTSKVNVSTRESPESSIPQKLYRCSVCQCCFIYLSSFIKSCKSHLTALNFETTELDLSVVVKEETDVIGETRDLDRTSFHGSDDDEMSSSTSASENNQSEEEANESSSKINGKRKKRSCVLPKDHVFVCKTCDKTFVRRQTYRDHLMGHQYPLIKCCTICSTQFSSGIIASKHKKKFHPELYNQELLERAEERAKYGRSKTIYHTIPRSAVTNNGTILPKKVRSKPQVKDFRIVLEQIHMPGFVKNEWMYLPKKDEHLWLVDKVKDEQKSKESPKQIKNEKETEMEWPSADENDESVDVKVESSTSDEKKSNFDEINDENSQKSKKVSGRNSSFYIKPEEIAHIPEFLGAKYIFNVYDERRNKKLKANKKKGKTGKKRKRGTSDEDSADSTEENSSKSKPFTKKQWVAYKPEPKTCLICGETRTKSNIRRHIASHCFEEDDRSCRICGTVHMAPNKLREHYSRVHNVKFREYLYKMQKEKMSKTTTTTNGDATLNYVTCSICYTNMKTEEHLKYHYDMLHNYKPGGGKTKATDLDCHLCGKVFKEAQTRNLHIRRIHKQMFDGQIFCHYCGKDFMGKGYLLSHFRYAHFDENGDFKESNASKTKYDYSKNKDKQLFICEMCGEVKETKITMMKHRHEKHGVLDPEYAAMLEKDYEENDCSHCGKKFTSIRKFKDHEKYHLKEQSNLFCSVCGIKCKTDIFLKAHMERHGEKKFFCEFEGCRKGFAVKYDYLTHKKRAHGTGESFPCKRCSQVFRTWKLRRNHEEEVHGIVKVKLQRNKRLTPNAGYKDDEGGDCRFCGKHFDNYRKWQNHEYHHKKMIPGLQCDICGSKSTTEYNLKRHMERHGEIQYFCEYPGCGKGFTVKHDVRIHSRRAHKDLFPPQQQQQQQQTISVSNSPVYSETNSQHFQVFTVMPAN